MDFEYLDNESENVLWGLLKKDSVLNCNVSGTAIELLVTKGYVNGKLCVSAELSFALVENK